MQALQLLDERVDSLRHVHGHVLRLRLERPERLGHRVAKAHDGTISSQIRRIIKSSLTEYFSQEEVGKAEQIFIVESDNEVGRQLAQALKETYAAEIPIYKLGAVVGTYAGPAAVGVAYVTPR